MTLTREQIEQLTNEEIEQLVVDVQAVHRDRVNSANAEARYNDTALSVHAGELPGSPWVRPISRAHGYPKGAVRTHNEIKYISTDFANTSEPGTPDSEWEEVPGEYPVWERGMLYDKDQMVAHMNAVFISTRSRNATEPGTRAGRLHWSIAEGEGTGLPPEVIL